MIIDGNFRIVGMSAVVPKECIDNNEIAENDKKILSVVKMTGIHKRHVLRNTDMRLCDYAVKSADMAIDNSSICKNDIKVVVYVTQEPELGAPSTAFIVQKELGLSKDCIVFDVNLGCTGFVTGTQVVCSVLNSINDDSAIGLLINADCVSNEPRRNANDSLLFGDGVSTTIFKKDNSKWMLWSIISDGYRYNMLMKYRDRTPSYMDGEGVFQFSISEVPPFLKSFLQSVNETTDKVDFLVLHQAQKFIIERIRKNLKIDEEKVLYSLEEYGNTSSASIPITICKNRKSLKDSSKILACGFGVGLSIGIAYFEIDKDSVCELVEL